MLTLTVFNFCQYVRLSRANKRFTTTTTTTTVAVSSQRQLSIRLGWKLEAINDTSPESSARLC